VNRRRRRAAESAGEPYRRSPALVVSWTAGTAVCIDCITGIRTALPLEVIEVLARLSAWTTVNQLVTSQPELGRPRDVQALLDALLARGLVQSRSTCTASWPWKDWMPEAAFFHFGTRDQSYRTNQLAYDMELREKARRDPPPPPTKSMRGFRVDLPPAGINGLLADSLRSRRTWRQFAARPVGLDKVGSLLHLTFGVQKHGTVEGQGPIVLKTSPSGGARHSIEAYLLALNVKGLRSGAYHYDADTHELVDLERPIGLEALSHALANQRWFLRAGALVVMSAVFERAMWRYPFNRAYRSILTEAGHLGQTFCLVATALDLAPFCTMAFRDSDLEAMIGIDGVSESAMYVVGVGTRPRGRVRNPGKIPAESER
jgi:SagB-type dehydrogenase family enzyme